MVYEGKAFPNKEGEQELEHCAPVFRTLVTFWDIGVYEWQTNDVPSRANYTEEVQEAMVCI